MYFDGVEENDNDEYRDTALKRIRSSEHCTLLLADTVS